jgi:hypothetical protein
MTRYFLTLLFSVIIITAPAQKTDTLFKKTCRFAGVYSYGKNVEKERVGSLTLFAETDSTLLFYIDLNRGAPSYNIGALYGRVVIVNDTGIFYRKSGYTDSGCKWQFTWHKNKVTIKTLDGQYSCDFGYGVFGDGVFRKYGPQKNSFINMEAKEIDFRVTKPENYQE